MLRLFFCSSRMIGEGGANLEEGYSLSQYV